MSTVAYPPEWGKWSAGLCHDWLTGMRGGERVLELLADGFPEAPIYTLLHNRESICDRINAHPIHVSPLQNVPGVYTRYRSFLPFMPGLIRTLKPESLDLVVSTSHCVAKSLKVRPETKHLCYCFTPMRYAWLFHDEYFPNPAKRAALKPVLAALRRWDKNTADRVHHFVAISEHVRDRIERFYGREADVVYPPADTEYFHPGDAPREEYDFIISAMVPYKKVDLAVQAYTESGFPLKVMGIGSGLDDLKRMAGPNVEFLGRQPDDVLRKHYQQCRFLVFPGEEDYGIVPVEAMACGTPVIAFNRGGATETVDAGVSGVFFDRQDVASLNQAVKEAADHRWDEDDIRSHATTFGIQPFIDGLHKSMVTCLKGS